MKHKSIKFFILIVAIVFSGVGCKSASPQKKLDTQNLNEAVVVPTEQKKEVKTQPANTDEDIRKEVWENKADLR